MFRFDFDLRKLFMYIAIATIVFTSVILTIPVGAIWDSNSPLTDFSNNTYTYSNGDNPTSDATDVLEEIANGELTNATGSVVTDAQSVIDGTYDPLNADFAFIYYQEYNTLPPRILYAKSPIVDTNYDHVFTFERFLGETGLRISTSARTWKGQADFSGAVTGTANSYYFTTGSTSTYQTYSTNYGFFALPNETAAILWTAGDVHYSASYDGILYDSYSGSTSAGGSEWAVGTDVINPCIGNPQYTNFDRQDTGRAISVIQEMEFGELGPHAQQFDKDNPNHSAIFWRSEVEHDLPSPFAIGLLFYEVSDTQQISIGVEGTENVIYIPSHAYLVPVSIDAVGEFGEPNQYYYFETTPTPRPTAYQSSKYMGASPTCVSYAINVNYEPEFTDNIIDNIIPIDVLADVPCDTFDIACHVGKIFDGVADTFIAVGQSIVSAIAEFFIPDTQTIADSFTSTFDLISEKLGFLFFPFEFLVAALNTIRGGSSCGSSCAINFGSWFTGDLVVDPIVIQSAVPTYWTVITNIIKASTVIALVYALYHKFHEVTRA